MRGRTSLPLLPLNQASYGIAEEQRTVPWISALSITSQRNIECSDGIVCKGVLIETNPVIQTHWQTSDKVRSSIRSGIL